MVHEQDCVAFSAAEGGRYFLMHQMLVQTLRPMCHFEVMQSFEPNCALALHCSTTSTVSCSIYLIPCFPFCRYLLKCVLPMVFFLPFICDYLLYQYSNRLGGLGLLGQRIAGIGHSLPIKSYLLSIILLAAARISWPSMAPLEQKKMVLKVLCLLGVWCSAAGGKNEAACFCALLILAAR